MAQTTQIKIKTKPRIFYFKRFKLLIQWHQKTNEQHQAIAQAEQEVEDSNRCKFTIIRSNQGADSHSPGWLVDFDNAWSQLKAGFSATPNKSSNIGLYSTTNFPQLVVTFHDVADIAIAIEVRTYSIRASIVSQAGSVL